MIRTAKKLYYGRLLERDKKNSKRTWAHINDLLNNKCSRQSTLKVQELVRNEIDGSDHKVTSALDIANTFNDFFVNVGENLANKIKDTKNNFAQYLGPCRDETLFSCQ